MHRTDRLLIGILETMAVLCQRLVYRPHSNGVARRRAALTAVPHREVPNIGAVAIDRFAGSGEAENAGEDGGELHFGQSVDKCL